MVITPFFVAIFALMCVVLALGVVKHRFRNQISYGDGNLHELQVAIRVHANFVEYTPLALLLMWFIETVAFDSFFAMTMGCVLMVGRVLHVIGMKHPKNYLVFRQIGMVATFLVLIVGALRILWHYLPLEIVT